MTEEKKSPNEEARAGTILLVDDDKFLLDMYSMKFTKANYAVHACLSASDALKVLRDGLAPDVIVFDLIMPENDGFSFLSALASEKLAPKAARIALTNESNDSAKAKALELGADRLLEKASVIPTEVVHIVDEEMEKSRKA